MIHSRSGRLGAMIVRNGKRFDIEVYTLVAGQKLPAWKSPARFSDKTEAKRYAEYVLGLRDWK